MVLSDPVKDRLAEAVQDVSKREGALRQVEIELEGYERAKARFDTSPHDPIYLLLIESSVEADIAVSSYKAELVTLESLLSTLR